MNISPLDLRQQRFRTALGGFDKVEVTSHGKVRRAKLYYLRELSGKAARLTGEEGSGA